MSASGSYFTQSSSTRAGDDPLTISPRRLLRTEAPNGVYDGATTSAPPRALRALTVDEALQYSPFSSIVPFDPNTVSLPTADTHASHSIFPNPTDKHLARRYVEDLNKDAGEDRRRMSLVNDALGSLQSLLDPNKLPQFQFRQPKSPSAFDTPSRSNGSFKVSNRLSPFSDMVLQATNVAYRYPDQNSVRVNVPDNLRDTPSKTFPTPKTSSPLEQNRSAYSYNAKSSVGGNLEESSLAVKAKPTTTVTTLSPSSHPEQHKNQDESEPKEVKSRKRRRSGDTELALSDQRTVSAAALKNLQVLLSEIFEAENNFQVDAAWTGDGLILACHDADGDRATISFPGYVKLEACLQKVISSGRFSDIPLDDITRLYGLCAGALNSVEGTDLNLQSSCTGDEIAYWWTGMSTALRSARIVLCIMSGEREEKQVHSEELLLKAIALLRKTTEKCIIPVVEARSSGPSSEVFHLASSNQKIMSQALHGANKVLGLLAELLSKEELAEGPITDIEYFAIQLLFVDNASSEKESVLGISKFEAFRRSAMNVITEIFTRYPDQRQFIVGEVLSSLQKLPTTKQHARQFKLDDGKRLQLTSVLLVRFVSNSGVPLTGVRPEKTPASASALKSPSAVSTDDEDDDVSTLRRANKPRNDETMDEADDAIPHADAIPNHLVTKVKSLYESTGKTALHIIRFFVKRAMISSKTGETPHRTLLDLFIEDLLAVLGLPDWPAAELLLRALVSCMVEIAESVESLTPAKSMALEVLGSMGTAILDVTAAARQIVRALETDDSPLSERLSQQFVDCLDESLDEWDVADWKGPYRSILQYLGDNYSDFQTLSARMCHLVQWTKFVLWGYRDPSSSNIRITDRTPSELAGKLCGMVADMTRLPPDDFDAVSSAQCRLAYCITLLNIGACRAFKRILNVLIASVKSDQIKVRSRSLKSVMQMLEKDPSLLDRMPQAGNLILRSTSDQSPMVRDNALVLLGKCVMQKSRIDGETLRPIIVCTHDNTVGIRKRSMKLLREIYPILAAIEPKIISSESLLQCVNDSDEGVSELARQILEELWLSPFWSSVTSDESVQSRVLMKECLTLIIQTMQRHEKNPKLMDAFFKYSMSDKSKRPDANTRVHAIYVKVSFEGMIAPQELAQGCSQRQLLQILTVFAGANPKLFSQQQLECLQPYIGNLSTTDDLNLFRRVVIILRCVLPTLPLIQKDFLKSIQEDLLKNVTKFAKTELNEVTACLWTINGVLGNIERLVNIEISVLTSLHSMEASDFSAGVEQPGGSASVRQGLIKTQRLINLAGHFGHHCDFQSQRETFSKSLPWLKDDLVAGKIVAAISPFVARKQPMALRSVALESIGLVCQAWPQNFNYPSNVQIFQRILRADSRELQSIVLYCFRDFFASQDQKFGAEAVSDEKDPLAHGKLGGSMTASDKDGASALIAQSFLNDILRISLASQDDHALAATEVMASICRQGLVHPKECAPALVALGTSENHGIAEVAVQMHESLHLQHESMFEREYMRAIHKAFTYQRDIVGNPVGYTLPHRAKLHAMYEVIKTSKSKAQLKFLSNYCAKLDFDLANLDVSGRPPSHLEYVRFLVENLAFFDYSRMEDLVHVSSRMEKIVAGTGASVAHAINTDIFKLILDPQTGVPLNVATEKGNVLSDAEPGRLRLLTTAAIILRMIWEARTFIRQVYAFNNKENRREGRGRPSKDSNKAPPRSSAISGDQLTRVTAAMVQALDSPELCLEQCKTFTEILAIDDEVKIAADSDEHDMGRPQTPIMDEEDPAVGSANGTLKRRGSPSLAETPQKKKRGRPPGSRNRKNVDSDE